MMLSMDLLPRSNLRGTEINFPGEHPILICSKMYMYCPPKSNLALPVAHNEGVPSSSCSLFTNKQMHTRTLNTQALRNRNWRASRKPAGLPNEGGLQWLARRLFPGDPPGGGSLREEEAAAEIGLWDPGGLRGRERFRSRQASHEGRTVEGREGGGLGVSSAARFCNFKMGQTFTWQS